MNKPIRNRWNTYAGDAHDRNRQYQVRKDKTVWEKRVTTNGKKQLGNAIAIHDEEGECLYQQSLEWKCNIWSLNF